MHHTKESHVWKFGVFFETSFMKIEGRQCSYHSYPYEGRWHLHFRLLFILRLINLRYIKLFYMWNLINCLWLILDLVLYILCIWLLNCVLNCVICHWYLIAISSYQSTIDTMTGSNYEKRKRDIEPWLDRRRESRKIRDLQVPRLNWKNGNYQIASSWRLLRDQFIMWSVVVYGVSWCISKSLVNLRRQNL